MKRIAKYVVGYLFGVTIVAVADNYLYQSQYLSRRDRIK